jgi:hypothetical protein
MTNTSVVIVNYNSGRFLEICVDSVRRSDCSLEIIIVDNASTDGSTNFLDSLTGSDPTVRLIQNRENSGFSAGVNRGVSYSKSENILLLNPDCLVFPHTIRLLSEALDIDSSAGIVGGLVFNFDGSEQRGCRRREPTLARSVAKVFKCDTFATGFNQVDMTDEPLPEKRIVVDAVSGSFLMIRRVTFVAVGGLDEDFFLHFEDLDLCRRVRDVGWKVVFAPDISIFHYQGGSSEDDGHRVSWEKHRSMRLYQRKHYGENLWFLGLVFLMVWGHFLLQRTKWTVTCWPTKMNERGRPPAEWVGLPYMTASTDIEKGNQLLVLGVIDETVREMINIGTATGWLIYAFRNINAPQQMADIRWIHPDYFDKVPVRDVPEINALLIAPLSSNEVVERLVEKFQVRRIAIIELLLTSDKSTEGNAAKLFEERVIRAMSARRLIEEEAPGGKTRLFSFSLSKSERESDSVMAQRDKVIQECFSWLST